MTQTNYDANAILMGGGGSPAWKFDAPGVHKRATITAPPQAKQEREYDPSNPGGGAPKVFPSGDPIMGVSVEVQTDERDPSRENDDGKRTFFIEGKRLKDAVRAGVKAAGAPGLEVGGILNVELTHYDTPGDRRSGCNWRVTYTPGGNSALMGEQPTAAAQPAATYNVQAAAQGQPAWGQQQQATPPAQPDPAVAAAAQNVVAGMDPAALADFQRWQQQNQASQQG